MNETELSRALRWSLPVVGAVASVTTGVVLGLEVALLVVAGFVLLGVILVLWSSIQALTGQAELDLEEALSLAAPSAEEEQKRAILRTLNDLKYERSVGKISDDDYAELLKTYTARAKELIQVVDAATEQSKETAERLLSKRLADAAPKRKRKRKDEPEPAERSDDDAESETKAAPFVDDEVPDTDEVSASSTPSPADSSIPCPECEVENDTDARFCKGCGTALEADS